MPSPTRLKIVTTRKMAAPGASTSHSFCCTRPVFRVSPQLATLESPAPRNDRLDSIRIAPAMPKLAVTSAGLMALGRM